MKTIGQFAHENNVTIKTLHHYEKLDLINPIKVDEATGYRYYSDEQAKDLKLILFLKELGLSLSEIKQVVCESFDKSDFVQFLETKRNQSELDKESALRRSHKISTIIDVLKSTSNKTIHYKELISMGEEQLYTGKYGRGKFIEESEKLYEESLTNSVPLSAVQMDLDQFFQVNKTFGHDVGDVVLKRTQDEIASVLQEYPNKSILERKGGDEYCITIQANGLETSMIVTKILNRVVAIDYSDVADDLHVSITAGVATKNKRTKSYSDLVHQATIKLYESKRG